MKKLSSILVAFLLVFSLVGTNVFAEGENHSVLNVEELKEKLENGLKVGDEIDLTDYLQPGAKADLIDKVEATNATVVNETTIKFVTVADEATFTVSFTNDEESRNFSTVVKENGQGTDVDKEDEEDKEDNPNIDNDGIEGFDTKALEAYLAEGVRQGTIIDVLDYYDQDSGLTVTSTTGDALTFTSQILLYKVGEVNFTVSDGEKSEDFKANVLEYPVTGLTFDKTEVTIGVGESVDMLLNIVPEDGWDDDLILGDGLVVLFEYNGTSNVVVSRKFSDTGEFVGFTLRGLTAGTGELVAYVADEHGNIDENYSPAVATINVGSGQVDPMDATPEVDTTAKGESPSAVNTADSTLLNVYVTSGMLSLAALAIIYTKKRNITSK